MAAADALRDVHALARSVFDAKGVCFEYEPRDDGVVVLEVRAATLVLAARSDVILSDYGCMMPRYRVSTP